MSGLKTNPCKQCGSTFHTRMSCPELAGERLERKRLKDATKSKTPITKPKKSLKRKSKSSPLKIAKDKAWESFAYYIRIRDSLATTGTISHCVCITCKERGIDEPKDFSHIQAGHAVGGRGNAVLFHEEIVNGQCDYCNNPRMGLGGDYGNYAIALIKRYGLEHVTYLQSLKRETKKYTVQELVEIKELYEEKTKELLTNHDISV